MVALVGVPRTGQRVPYDKDHAQSRDKQHQIAHLNLSYLLEALKRKITKYHKGNIKSPF